MATMEPVIATAVAAVEVAPAAPTTAVTSVPAAAAPAEVTPALLEKIKVQVDYWFGNANLRRDKFLLDRVNEDTDGWVALSVLTTFNRMKTLTTDVKVIADAVESSSLLELSEDRAAVRRSIPMPLEDDSEPRSAYAKGVFPPNTTLEELQALFSAYGTVSRVFMRKTMYKTGMDKSKMFKGSVFVEFADKAGVEALLAAKEAGTLVYNGKPVEKVMLKATYAQQKRAEFEAKRAKKLRCLSSLKVGD